MEAIFALQVAAAVAAASTPSTVLSYYPPPAIKAHVDGTGAVRCDSGEHLGLRACVVTWEYPEGYGFGEAAVKLAGLIPDNTDVTTTPGSAVLVFTFCHDPQSITPNPLEPRHLIVAPKIDRAPSDDERSSATVAANATPGLSARIVMNCTVGLEGSLNGCAPLFSIPRDSPLSAAAVALASDYHATPEVYDGKPRGGGRLQVVVALGPAPPPMPPPVLAPQYQCQSIR